ncbi:MAG: hypothetical protein ACK2UO_20305, partial [Caldilineaceae bacterium]
YELQAGLFAIGHIDRAVTPGAFPEGTAIRFRDTQICRRRGAASDIALHESRPSDETHLQWRYEALRGLGQTYFGLTNVQQAEEHLRNAFDLGKKMELSPTELVRLLSWLEESVYWQEAHHADREVLRIASEGLELLAKNDESVETALMLHYAATYLHDMGYPHMAADVYTGRIEQIVRNQPYVDELRSIYMMIVSVHLNQKNLKSTAQWLRDFEEKTRHSGDLRGLGEAFFSSGVVQWARGDYANAINVLKRSYEQFMHIGDTGRAAWVSSVMAHIYLNMGQYAATESTIQRCDDLCVQDSSLDWVGYRTNYLLSILNLQMGRAKEALSTVNSVIEIPSIRLATFKTAYANLRTEILLTLERCREAWEQAYASIPNAADANAPLTIWAGGGPPMDLRAPWAETIGKLQAASHYPDQFRSFCDNLRSEYSDTAPAFTHWYLEPADLNPALENFVEPVSSEHLKWIDPYDDSVYTDNGDAIEMFAANGRELWLVNRSAPRLLFPVSGDFALETTVTAALDDRPAMGGLLLWHGDEDYVCLDWGHRRPDEISFEGCIANEDLVFGRGKLPGDNIRLSLERKSDQVRALCSADGDTWFTAGKTTFAVEDDIQAGLFAIGHIDRAVTPGAFPEGTAIRFRDTHILR